MSIIISDRQLIKEAEMSTFERYVKQGSGGNTARLWTIGVIVAIVLIIIWNGFVTVPAGHKGVVLRFGDVKGTIDPGLHLLIPFVEKVELMETRQLEYSFKAETFSKQQQDVYMDIVILYAMNPEYIKYIYETYGNVERVTEKIVRPSSNQVIKAVASQFDTTTIHVSREKIKSQCEETLMENTKSPIFLEVKNGSTVADFRSIGTTDMINTDRETKAVTWNGITRNCYVFEKTEDSEILYFLDNVVNFAEVNIVNISYSEAYTQAIEDKQIAQQKVEKAERELEEAKTRKEIAKTQAEAKKIEQELINVSLTPAILQSRWIEKWNGILPSVMGGDNGLILDIGSLGGN